MSQVCGRATLEVKNRHERCGMSSSAHQCRGQRHCVLSIPRIYHSTATEKEWSCVRQSSQGKAWLGLTPSRERVSTPTDSTHPPEG